jgi:hypothetical protein
MRPPELFGILSSLTEQAKEHSDALLDAIEMLGGGGGILRAASEAALATRMEGERALAEGLRAEAVAKDEAARARVVLTAMCFCVVILLLFDKLVAATSPFWVLVFCAVLGGGGYFAATAAPHWLLATYALGGGGLKGAGCDFSGSLMCAR